MRFFLLLVLSLSLAIAVHAQDDDDGYDDEETTEVTEDTTTGESTIETTEEATTERIRCVGRGNLCKPELQNSDDPKHQHDKCCPGTSCRRPLLSRYQCIPNRRGQGEDDNDDDGNSRNYN